MSGGVRGEEEVYPEKPESRPHGIKIANMRLRFKNETRPSGCWRELRILCF